MATDSDLKSVHLTLSGTTADTITLTQLWDRVEVGNEHDTVDLFVRMDGVTAVSDADGSTRIGPNETKILHPIHDWTNKRIVISVVGNANPYSIEGVV